MKYLNVPFVEDPDDKCMPCSIGMVLKYFMPEAQWSMDDFIEITGYIPGKGTWPAESMVNLSGLGFETLWIEDFDNQAFIADPAGYLATILDPEALKWQVENSNLAVEAQRIKDYLDAGNTIEERKGTIQDIRDFLDDGWLVRLEVNANPLAGVPGYEGHSVIVIGYDAENVAIHNPDGTNGNQPGQVVSWTILEQAWEEFGGTKSVYAYKRKE